MKNAFVLDPGGPLRAADKYDAPFEFEGTLKRLYFKNL